MLCPTCERSGHTQHLAEDKSQLAILIGQCLAGTHLSCMYDCTLYLTPVPAFSLARKQDEQVCKNGIIIGKIGYVTLRAPLSVCDLRCRLITAPSGILICASSLNQNSIQGPIWFPFPALLTKCSLWDDGRYWHMHSTELFLELGTSKHVG